VCAEPRGAQNGAAALGPITGLRLNEWLAAPASGSDFLELYNTGHAPVPLAGTALTDDLSVAGRAKFPIPGAQLYRRQRSGALAVLDRRRQFHGHARPRELRHRRRRRVARLYTSAGVALDTVSFGLQTVGQSSGRYPDGVSGIIALNPTPAPRTCRPSSTPMVMACPTRGRSPMGFNPNNPADAALDADGDGLTNKAEYLAGTDPHLATSRLVAEVVRTGSLRSVRFNVVPARPTPCNTRTT
jgi:hypothetical protein